LQEFFIRMLRSFFIFILLATYCLAGFSQAGNPPVHQIHKAEGKIQLDGIPDEESWAHSDSASGFWMSVPYDTAIAATRTVARMTYDDKNIYVSAVCYDDLPDRSFVIQSLKRDYSYPVSDGFGIYLDPFCDQTNGFAFTCNPFGVQREGLLANGGYFGVSTDWDNRWFVETHMDKDRWTLEMAIPFKSIRYNKGTTKWMVNFSRNNLKRNEGSAWSRVPRTYNIASLFHTGELIWDAPPQKTGANVSIIPYLIASSAKDYTIKKGTDKFDGGGDAKIIVSSSLNLDLTVNPDFSQVEVDRQQTNLSRFSLFFPEKRNFFIENSDLFGAFGFDKMRPFFSRNIGLYQGSTIPIYGGARLSGKINKRWRIGMMDMQTKESVTLHQPGYNFGVMALQYNLLGKSTISALLLNRESYVDGKLKPGAYQRLGGIEFNYASKDNLLNGKVFYHHILDSISGDDKSAAGIYSIYKSTNWTYEFTGDFSGNNFNPVVGYLGYDNGALHVQPRIAYSIYPDSKKLIYHGPEVFVSQYWSSAIPEGKLSRYYVGKPLDGQYRFGYFVKWRNTAIATMYLSSWYTYLRRPYDPGGGVNKPKLPAGTSYNYADAYLNFTSDFRKKMNYQLTADYGSYFNGDKWTWIGTLNLRVQPIAILSAVVERDEIRLPAPYSNGYLTLIGPKFEFAFTRSIFFTAFLQYNSQISNLNINTRFQWRFAPMSDLFVVYTDNYFAPDPSAVSDMKFGVKNRGVVLKLNYWFTL